MKNKKRKYKIKALLVISMLVIFICGIPGSYLSAGSLSSSYDILKNDPTSKPFVDRMITGGATHAQLEAFLQDLDAEVSKSGEITEANFNPVMYQALQEVLTWKTHRNVFRVLSSEFSEEIQSIMSTGRLEGDLIPLRNAVMNHMLNKNADTNTNTGKGGSGGAPVNSQDPVLKEVKQQLDAHKTLVKLILPGKNGELNITGETFNKITAAGKELHISNDNILISIPPEALNLNNNSRLSIRAQVLSADKVKESLSKLAKEYQLVGNVYELFATTQESVSGVKFDKPLIITLSFSDYDVEDAKALLDAYYYNEKTSQWEKMNGTVDKANKTVSFKTTHFSKYAIMAYTPATTATNPPVTLPNRFTDINGHWAQTKIETLVNLGLVSGISDTEFAPQQNITRAEFAAILVRALKLPFEVQYQGQFFDVQADQWYFSVVNTAAKAGLINGYDKNHFGPNDPVTREQMALMIKNAMDYKGKNVELTDTQTAENLAIFSDTYAIAAWARTSVATAVQAQIITGHSDGRFAPHDNATRAQAAVMILQMYNQI